MTLPRRALNWALDRPVTTCAIVLYILLALFGVTTSSLGIATLRQDPGNPIGTEVGPAQPIRSDEYLTETPIALGQIAAAEAFQSNPLAEPPGFLHQIPSGPTTSVTFFEGSLTRLAPWIPDEMLFAARWWLATLLLVIFAPLWFREITGRARFGYLCAALIFFAPSNTWWSYRPVTILGFVFAGSYLVFPIMRHLQARRRTKAALLALTAGVLLARVPGNYQPFAIVAGLPVIVTTAVTLFLKEIPTRVKVIAVALVGGSSLIFAAGLVAENWPSLQAALHTVYPGVRRSTGEHLSVWQLLSAPALGVLAAARQTDGTNASEFSSAFTVALAWAGVLAITWKRGTERPYRFGVFTMAAFATFWLAWSTVDWGRFGVKLPIANLVPANRAGAMLGIIASILICLVLAQWQPPRSWWLPIAAGVAVALLSAWGGISLGNAHYPGLSATAVWLSAFATGACVMLISKFPNHNLPLLLTFGALVYVSFRVNPIVVGLGDLRASSTAKAMLGAGSEARDSGTYWASESGPFDSLMLATGVPSLSSRQQLGPNIAEWEKLDPTHAYEDTWNRGGTYIRFSWTNSDKLSFELVAADNFVISVSPCALHDREPRLKVIAATRQLALPCLKARDRLVWSGQVHWIYDVT